MDRLGLKAGCKTENKIEENQKAEIQQRVQHVVNKIHMNELTKILDLLNNVFDDPQKPYYIGIDRLDENWVDETIRYKLVSALIETAKDFRIVENVKIFIVLRQDLLNQIFYNTRSPGFQQEKYESLCVNVGWLEKNLKELLDKRIENLSLEKGLEKGLTFSKVLPKNVNKENSIDYVINRTLLRPRDAIIFINECIKKCDNKPQITASILKEAEAEYSKSRLNALIDEWFSEYPNIFNASKHILYGRNYRFNLSEISEEDILEMCFQDDKYAQKEHCKIFKLIKKVLENHLDIDNFRIELIKIFYKVGLIGVKIKSTDKFAFSFKCDRMSYDIRL